MNHHLENLLIFYFLVSINLINCEEVDTTTGLTISSRSSNYFPNILNFIKGTLGKYKQTPNKNVDVLNDSKTQENEEEGEYEYEDEDFGTDDGFDDFLSGMDLEKDVENMGESSGVNDNKTMESRQMNLYMFQGQYMPEPRLNRFIDGAMENLKIEMVSSSLDPIYFRVLPRGKVASREKPIRRFPNKQKIQRVQRRRRKQVQGRRHHRHFIGQLSPQTHDDENKSSDENLSDEQSGEVEGRLLLRRRKNGQVQKVNQNRNPAPPNNRKRVVRKNKNGNVGAGRVEGLSRVSRDGDAEMQLFGNYTLIRAHHNIGPVEVVMQFRTRRGLRRAGATLPKIKTHTVTRVNNEGCEMVDFLLDTPHPETIVVRGKLFPIANRVARNIFSRLFQMDSFLVARMKEKSGLALLSQKSS